MRFESARSERRSPAENERLEARGKPSLSTFDVVGSVPGPLVIGADGPLSVTFLLGRPAPAKGVEFFLTVLPEKAVQVGEKVRFAAGSTRSEPIAFTAGEMPPGRESQDILLYFVHMLLGQSRLTGTVLAKS